ncbi:MAG: hypothetical protein ACLQOO_16380, partial [Terriglobia bacterium]
MPNPSGSLKNRLLVVLIAGVTAFCFCLISPPGAFAFGQAQTAPGSNPSQVSRRNLPAGAVVAAELVEPVEPMEDGPVSVTHRASSVRAAAINSGGAVTRTRSKRRAQATAAGSVYTDDLNLGAGNEPASEPALLDSQADTVFQSPGAAASGPRYIGYNSGFNSLSGTAHAPVAGQGGLGLGFTHITRPNSPTNDTFTNGDGTGVWSDVLNWSAGSPTGDNVFITGTGSASSVTEDKSDTINNLTLNSNNSWTLNDARSLTIDGSTVTNGGTMTINSGGDWTELIIGGSAVTLSGSGKLILSDFQENAIYGATGTEVLTNQGAIQGSGYIGYNPYAQTGYLTLNNQGTINAMSSKGNALGIDPGSGGVTNTGLMEASSGGTLQLYGSINNTGGMIEALSGGTVYQVGGTLSGGLVEAQSGGTLKVDGTVPSNILELASGSNLVVGTGGLVNNAGNTLTAPNGGTVYLEGTTGGGTISGGTLNTAGTGVIGTPPGNNGTLDGTSTLTNAGAYEVFNSSTTFVKGTLNNTGSFTENANGNWTVLAISGNVTLEGSSPYVLSDDQHNTLYGASTGTEVLTNQGTIQGSGYIGYNPYAQTGYLTL